MTTRSNLITIVAYALLAIFCATMLLQFSVQITLILTGLTAMLAIEAVGVAAVLGLPLNVFTTTIVVLTVGLGVDEDAHIAHHFLLQAGDSARVRAIGTMRAIGGAVFHAAMSTLLGLAVTSASDTEIVR